MTAKAFAVLRLLAAACLVLCAPQIARAQLNETCTVSVLNRNVRVNPDGSWVLPNIPANFGPVRARVTCIVDGQTVSGESDPFVIPPSGAVNVPPIRFGQSTPIPSAIAVTAPTRTLTHTGETVQLNVLATYSNSSTKDISAASTGTQYTITNPAIATVTADGLVTAVKSGTVLVQATHEGAGGMISIQVTFNNADSDGDGIPDEAELALGLNPNNPVDAQEDLDRDGLSNRDEYERGTDLRKDDTDGDGLKDGDEVARGTSPLLRDTDGDGVNDALEVQSGTNPLNPASFNFGAVLSNLTVVPAHFTLTFNTIAGDATRQLGVTGTLLDGTTIDLTSTARGANYASSDLNICNFGAADGLIFAGQSGECTITVSVGTHQATAGATVHRFAPTALSSVSVPGPLRGVDLSGDWAFIAAGASGLQVVNVANPTAPQVVGALPLAGTAIGISIAGNRAYVAAGAAGLHVVDVTNPAAPFLLGTVDTPGNASNVRVRGSLAYVADGSGGLQIVDASNSSAPKIIGALATIGTANSIALSDNFALVAADFSLKVIDITNPASPALRGTANLSGTAVAVVARGTTAYVGITSPTTFAVVDFSTPTTPAIKGSVQAGFLTALATSGRFVLGANSFFSSAAQIFEVSDPVTPAFRANLTFPLVGAAGGTAVAADGSYVYMTTGDRLYIGQYILTEDLEGFDPSVAITAPASGTTVFEGDTISVSLSAVDDVGVAAVTVLVDGQPLATDRSEPYEHTFKVPFGVTSLTLGARATDFGGNVGSAQEITLTVQPGFGRIAGRVTDVATGNPLANVTVRIFDSAGAVVTQVGTAASGEFSTGGLPAGTYFVATSNAPGFANGLYRDLVCNGCVPTTGTPVTVVNGSTTSGIDFALLPLGRITGRVTQDATGAGIANLAVQVFNSTGTLVSQLTTDGSGNYATVGLAPGNYFARTSNSQGFQDLLYASIECTNCVVTTGTPIVVVDGVVSANINFALKTLGRISGRVTDAATGAAFSNVTIQIYNAAGSFVAIASTNATGNYTSGGLTSGTYFARTAAPPPGYLDGLYAGQVCASCSVTSGSPIAVSASTGITANIDFPLVVGGRITGRVTDSATGAALPNVTVQLYTATNSFVASAATNTTGDYTVQGLNAGTYFARTAGAPAGYLNGLYSGQNCLSCSPSTGTPIAVALATTISNVNFALAIGGRVTGRVTDSSTGAAVQSVTVQLYNASGTFVTSAATNATGNYTIQGLLADSYYARTSGAPAGLLDGLYSGQNCVSCVVTTGTAIPVTLNNTTSSIDFALTLGGRVTGRVTDAASGTALPNVTVQIYSSTNTLVNSTTTNSAGTYTIQGLLTGTYFSRTANAPSGYLDGLYSAQNCMACAATTGTPISVTIGTTTSSVDFALAVGGRITGRVTDAATGTALANVTVQVYNASNTFVTSAVTNATGTYTAQSLITGTYFARTSNAPSGYLDGLYNGQMCVGCLANTGTPIAVTTGSTASSVDFALATGGRITGRVTDSATGTPLSGVTISVSTIAGSSVGSASTNASGVYTVQSLLSGRYVLRTSNSQGYLDVLHSGRICVNCSVVSGTPISVTVGSTVSGIDFALTQGGRITGRVTDAATGNPLQNASVSILSVTGATVTSASTNASGVYTAQGLLTGTYYARTANSLGYVDKLHANQTCVGCNVLGGTPIQVTSGGTVSSIDFALVTGGRVTGRVTDVIAGTPIANVSVAFYSLTGVFVASGSTNGSGIYTAQGLLAGSYYARTSNSLGYVDALYPGGTCVGCDVTTGTLVPVTLASTTSGIDFQLAAGGRVTGVVTDATTGAPVGSVNVQLYTSTGSFAVSTFTSSNGAYTALGLATGTYYARTSNAPGYVDGLYSGQQCVGCSVTTGTAIPVTAGQTTPGVDFALTPGGRISGRVIDAATGAPLAGITVQIYASTGSFLTSSSTATNGTYTASQAIAAGSYFARTSNSSGYVDGLYSGQTCTGCTVTTGTPITVTNGETTTGVDFALTLGGRITGQVTDSTGGVPLGGISVLVYSSTGAFVSSASTSNTGTYVVQGLPSGSFYARTSNSGGYVDGLYSGQPCLNCTVTTGTSIVVTAGAATPGIDFALTLSGRIAGRVTDAATGFGISGAFVQVYSSTGSFVGTATASGTGEYILTGISAGTYFARTVSTTGYADSLYSGLPCVNCSVTTGTAITVTLGNTTTGIDFALTQGGRISGRVTDAASGIGLPSVSVLIYNSAGSSVVSVSTSGDGTYLAVGLANGSYFARTNSSSRYADGLYQGQSCLGCNVLTGTAISVTAGATSSGIDFALSPGGRVAGRVTSSATGAGLASVSVQIVTATGATATTVVTNAEGLYQTIVGLPTGSYFARTSNSLGYLDEAFNDVLCAPSCTVTNATSIAVVAGLITPNINFELIQGGRISGRVTDAATGATVSGVTVQVFTSAGSSITSTTTNSAGVYTTAAPLTDGSFYVRTSQSLGYLDELYDNILCSPGCTVTAGNPVAVTVGSTTSGIDFALTPGGKISGRVTDAATGAAIPSVTVQIYNASGSTVTSTSTNATGNYTTAVALVAGNYFVRTFNSSGYLDESYNNRLCAPSCTVTDGNAVAVTLGATSSGIDFALATGGRISGRVTNVVTGAPLGSITVNVYTTAGTFVTNVNTTSAGTYQTTAGLATGNYVVRTSNGQTYIDKLYNDLPCSASCSVTNGTPVAVTAGGTTEGVDFALSPGGRISGRVTDAATGLGLQSVSVAVYTLAGVSVNTVSTDATGNYVTSAGLTTGPYVVLTFNAGAYVNELFDNLLCSPSCAAQNGTPVQVTTGGTTAGIDFALSLGGRIGGRVIDSQSGAGVPSITVQVYNSAGGFVSSANTNSAGVYLVSGLPAGSYFATASGSTHIGSLYSNKPCTLLSCDVTTGNPIAVLAGETTSAIDLSVAPGGRISGRVTAAATGAPLSGVFVQLYSQTGSVIPVSVSTGTDGTYTTPANLPTGVYYVRTSGPVGYVAEVYDNVACVSCAVTAGAPVSVTTGATTVGIDFALQAAGSIAGTITDIATGVGVSSVTVQIHSDTGVFVASATTNLNGAYAVTAILPAGGYFARTSNSVGYLDALYSGLNCAPTCSVTQGTPIQVSAGTVTSGIDMALRQGGRITGTVSDTVSGDKLQNLAVQVYTSAGVFVTSSFTNASGIYVTGVGLPAGSYLLRTSNSIGYLDELANDLLCSPTCSVIAGSPVLVALGATTSGVDFTLTRGGRISGSVIDAATGAPLSSLSVQIYQAAGGLVTTTSTDSSGRYLTGAGLVSGSYFVRTSNSQGYLNEMHDDVPCPSSCAVVGAAPVTVAAGSTTTGVDFALSRGGRIAGRVTESATGGVLGGVSVRIYSSAGALITSASTNSSGAYATVGLQDGLYFVRTSNNQGYIDQLYPSTVCLACAETSGTAVQVTAGTLTSGIDFSLNRGARISGRVTDTANGAGLGFVTVSVYSAGGLSIGDTTTDSTGNFATTGLLPGNYFVRTSNLPGYVDGLYSGLTCVGCLVTSGTPVPVVGTTTTTGINLPVTRGGRIAGRVTDAGTGAGLVGVTVNIHSSTGVLLATALTDTGGEYISTGLPAATYFVRTVVQRAYLDGLFNGLPCVNCNVTTGTGVVVTLGSTRSNVDFALTATGIIAGRVIDPDTGRGLAGVTVRAFDSAGAISQSVRANASGYYSLSELAPGSYVVSTSSAPRYLKLLESLTCAGCSLDFGTQIRVQPGRTAVAVDLTVVAGDAEDNSGNAPTRGAPSQNRQLEQPGPPVKQRNP